MVSGNQINGVIIKKILFVESSPRKEKSISSDMCNKVIRNLQIGGEYTVDHVDLWDADLPQMKKLMKYVR
ncbi:NAD(P)H-dependent oxidoreductase [Moritella sp. JT01]|uniref:NAD(P)H-dependent oxidoreductase n=1 Tax=Moritella sp. JT01 TaxID=756698 RepID=UPI000829E120|nr:NAD(P)H-dependent oxidoreductase [Moritella sp. JT01]